MITKIKARINFSRYLEAELVTKANSIFNCLYGNANFPSPTPTLDSLKQTIDEYNNALVACKTEGSVSRVYKRTCRKKLEAALNLLGMYVNYTCNFNEDMLAGSGYTLTKNPSRLTIDAPQSPRLRSGKQSGEIFSSVPVVINAISYIHEISTDPAMPESNLLSFASTRRSYTFTGLVPGSKYWIRVVAIGSRGQVAYGPMAYMFAQ